MLGLTNVLSPPVLWDVLIVLSLGVKPSFANRVSAGANCQRWLRSGAFMPVIFRVQLICNPGVNDLFHTGQSALQVAIVQHMPEVALAVLDHPEFEQVNARDFTGATALHAAVATGSKVVCQAIIGRQDFREILAEGDKWPVPEMRCPCWLKGLLSLPWPTACLGLDGLCVSLVFLFCCQH